MSQTSRLQLLSKNPELLKFCRQLPKIELHAHLNGSLRASTVQELFSKKQATNPYVRFVFSAHFFIIVLVLLIVLSSLAVIISVRMQKAPIYQKDYLWMNV
jgi:hypothetical protein